MITLFIKQIVSLVIPKDYLLVSLKNIHMQTFMGHLVAYQVRYR